MYACAHVGVLYDFENNRQHILQGHVSIIRQYIQYVIVFTAFYVLILIHVFIN